MTPNWKMQQAAVLKDFGQIKALSPAGDNYEDHDLGEHIDRRIEALEKRTKAMNAAQKTYTPPAGCLAPGRCEPPFCCTACSAALPPPRTRRVLRRKKVGDDLTEKNAEMILQKLREVEKLFQGTPK